MNYNQRIKELEREIEVIKIKQHNDGMRSVAKQFQKEVRESETKAEDKFYDIARKKGIKLVRQYKINIIRKKDGYIKRFYFADFCDILNKVIFEIDGGYHFTKEQRKKDKRRENDLKRAGYKVFRISNYQVYSGKSTQFLIDSYKSIGIII